MNKVEYLAIGPNIVMHKITVQITLVLFLNPLLGLLDQQGRRLQTAGDAALARIAQASEAEPCGGVVNVDSSQGCKVCGAINYIPYQSCGAAQPVSFCQ